MFLELNIDNTSDHTKTKDYPPVLVGVDNITNIQKASVHLNADESGTPVYGVRGCWVCFAGEQEEFGCIRVIQSYEDIRSLICKNSIIVGKSFTVPEVTEIKEEKS